MITCIICGKKFDKPHYGKPYDDVCGSECFHEKYWRLIEQRYINGAPFIIIDGNIYTDGGHKSNPSNTSFLGHGGREFKIKINDGTEIFTNNLWHGGEIPDGHREILCDNAVFIQ